MVDYEKVAKSAMEAIEELEALEEEKWKSDEGSEEYQSYFSSDSIEDDDDDDDNERFKEVYLEPQPTEMSDDVCVEEEEGVSVVNVEIKEVVSLTTSDELLQLKKIRRVSKVVLQNQE